MVNQFYSASIVGFLLSEPSQFINSLETLTKSNLEVGIEDMAYNYDFIAVGLFQSLFIIINSEKHKIKLD